MCTKKIKEILNKFKNIDQRDLEIFISEILDKDKSFAITYPEHKLSLFQYLKLLYFIKKRKQGYSVAAIVGHKEFYNLDFFVNKHVLIPRPDTEIMVEEATRIMNDELRIKNTSGCIPISILKTVTHKNIKAVAIDISRSALRVAQKNAQEYNINIKFLNGNLLEPIIHNSKFIIHDSTLVITANLPYLTEFQFQNEESIQREPKNALVADKQGLALYEELLKQVRTLPDYCQLFLLLEIDPSQSESVIKLIQKYLPVAKTEIGASPHISGVHSGKKKEFSSRSFNLEIKKDLSGLDRLVIIKSLSF